MRLEKRAHCEMPERMFVAAKSMLVNDCLETPKLASDFMPVNRSNNQLDDAF